MPSWDVSEHWTLRRTRLGAGDLLARAGCRPFALLHGDGPGADWLILSEEPFLVFEDPQLPPLQVSRQGDLPPFFPDFLGHVAYEYGYGLDPILPPPPPAGRPFPPFRFAMHRRLSLYHKPSGSLYEARREGAGNTADRPHALGSGPFSARKRGDTDTPASYEAKVAAIRGEIARGNVYQVSLTRQEAWQVRGDLRTFAQRLMAANPAPWSALLADPDLTVISSSPERFIRIRDGLLLSSPIKGTCPRSPDPVQDRRLAQELLASPKNRAELAMIADLIRNDLSRVCRVPSVELLDFPQLQSFANVHHLVAHVQGVLEAGTPLAALLRTLFPGGSITGCPKLSAMSLIRRLEETPRQPYTGAIGWFTHDLSALDFSLAIRTAWVLGDELRFGVGGGVIWDSDPREEYLETVHKGSSLVACLEG